MSTRVIKLKDYFYNNHNFDILWVIVDDHFSPPLLPLLFTAYLCRFGSVIEAREFTNETRRERISSLHFNDIADKSIRTYVYCLARFLKHLDNCRVNDGTPGLHSSSACSEKFVNHYLNNILINELSSSDSLETHRSAITSYYNWLDYMEICPRLNIKIYRKTRQLAANISTKQQYIQYVTRCKRTELLNTCKTLAEKLIIRMGFEVGLRTCELTGLRVDEKNDLRSLFNKLNNADFSHKEHFRYWLEARYAKGGSSRWIYFDRLLLIDMKRYFDTERQRLINQTGSKDTSFFLRTDNRFKGTGITESQGSNVFRRRKLQAGLNPLLNFHDLRHTFATELYHSELEGLDGRETRSESAALIVVAQRLGHKFSKNGQAPPVTTKYIRMLIQMLELEEDVNG